MSILGKLFKKPESPAQSDQAPSPSSDPANDPNLIRVFDEYGREFFISKDEWRTNVLPGALKSNWNNPDQLCEMIISALNDGFLIEIEGAAERLYELDPDSSRNACVYAIVLIKNERLNDAEKVLRSFLEKNGVRSQPNDAIRRSEECSQGRSEMRFARAVHRSLRRSLMVFVAEVTSA